MGYASLQDIEYVAGGHARFVSLADWDEDGEVDEAVVAAAQSRGDGFIDGYLRIRYTTPLTNPTDTIKRLSADETIYQLKCARGLAIGPADIEQRKERTAELELMRTGELRPDLNVPENPRSARSAWISNDETAVSRNNLKGMW